jgi:hypothetical protein
MYSPQVTQTSNKHINCGPCDNSNALSTVIAADAALCFVGELERAGELGFHPSGFATPPIPLFRNKFIPNSKYGISELGVVIG